MIGFKITYVQKQDYKNFGHYIMGTNMGTNICTNIGTNLIFPKIGQFEIGC